MIIHMLTFSLAEYSLIHHSPVVYALLNDSWPFRMHAADKRCDAREPIIHLARDVDMLVMSRFSSVSDCNIRVHGTDLSR